MNFVLNNYHVDERNISFLETKKNNIIDGNFTKIIYKDTFVTVNGIYLLFPVIVTGVDKSNGKTNVFFNPKIASNTSIINHISDIEGKIINCYKQEYNVSYKINMSTLFNLLYNGKVKLYKEINYNVSGLRPPTLGSFPSLTSFVTENIPNPSRINLVTYHEFVSFPPPPPCFTTENIPLPDSFEGSERVVQGLDLRSPTDSETNGMFSVTNEVSEGKLPNSVERSSKEFGTKSGAVGGAFLSDREDDVALAESSGVKDGEGVGKLSFRSGSVGGPERPSTLHRLSGDAEERFLDSTSRIFFAKLENPMSNECEALREKLRFSDQSPTKIVLKISGIWETANEIGITYKFLDMH